MFWSKKSFKEWILCNIETWMLAYILLIYASKYGKGGGQLQGLAFLAGIFGGPSPISPTHFYAYAKAQKYKIRSSSLESFTFM